MLNNHMNEKIGFKRNMKTVERKNKVLLINKDNAETIFISKECFDIINQAIDEELSFQELIDFIEEEESKLYFEELISRIADKRFWKYDDREIECTDYEISIDITNKCNLRCRHCCISAGENICGDDLSEDDIMLIVKQVVSMQPASICISGGEPLIRKDFTDIVRYIRSHYSKKLILMTNATLIGEEMADFIAHNFDGVDVSIDGFDEDSCKILRGAGTFDKCIRGIKNLQAKGVTNISASMVVTNENEYAKPEFGKLCDSLGIYPIIRGLDLVGRAKGSLEAPFDVDAQMSKDQIKDIFHKHQMWNNSIMSMGCQGAKVEFHISYTGDIFPCGALIEDEFWMGNVLKIQNLKEYLESGKYKETDGYKRFISYMPTKLEHCENCDFNLLCFSCVSEIRNKVINNTIYKDCEEDKYRYSLYWENYESV